MATQDEIAVAERFLRVYNAIKNTNFVLTKNQPPQDDTVDVQALDVRTEKLLKMQVRVSDDEPFKPLKRLKPGEMFERKGVGFEIHHNAIKHGILSKSQKYTPADKIDLILVLNGWQGVRQEDIEEFKSSEQQLLKQTGFREIWFVGKDIIEQFYINPKPHF